MNGAGAVEALAEREHLLWVAAVCLYGVGDGLTTVWGLSTTGVAEAGPLAAPIVDRYGSLAFLGYKTILVTCFYGLWSLLRSGGRVAIPVTLVLVGGIVTIWNLTVILAASA